MPRKRTTTARNKEKKYHLKKANNNETYKIIFRKDTMDVLLRINAVINLGNNKDKIKVSKLGNDNDLRKTF